MVDDTPDGKAKPTPMDEAPPTGAAEPMSAAVTAPLVRPPSAAQQKSVLSWLPWLVVAMILFAAWGVLRVAMPDVFGGPPIATHSPTPTISVTPTSTP
jgi:hypothetical protein